MKKKLTFKNILLLIPLFLSLNFYGQDTIRVTRKYFLESGILVSSASQTPFWLRANALGVVPNTGTNFTMRAGAIQEYATKNSHTKKYSW